MLAASEPAREIARLEEAALIWRELRDPLGEARVDFLAALLARDSDGAAEAERRLHALGARGYRTSLARSLPLDDVIPRDRSGARPVPRRPRGRARPTGGVAIAQGT